MKNLTNEHLRKIFRSTFDLANFAIEYGRQVVLDGNFHTLDSLIKEVQYRAEHSEDPELKEKYGII
jgi:hypothetical protein